MGIREIYNRMFRRHRDEYTPTAPPSFSSTEPLNSTDTNLADWPPFQHPNYGNDGAILLPGTLAQMARHFLDAIFVRKLANTGIHQIRGAAAGVDDIQYLVANKREVYTYFSRDGDPTKMTWHIDSPIVEGHYLGRGYVRGLESNPELGAQVLIEKPLLRRDLDRVAAEFVRAAYVHRLTACKLTSIGAFGGHSSWGQYLVQKISQELELTMHLALKVLPSPDELLSVENAQGELYRMLTTELARNEIPIVYQNRHRGFHETDDALAQGLITLAASSKDGSDLDGSSLKRAIKEYGCSWVEAYPTFVYTPCGKGTEDSLRLRQSTAYAINLPDVYGGRNVDILLHETGKLIARANDALHIITVNAWFNDAAEVAEYKEAAVLLRPGHVVPVVNRIESPEIFNYMAKATLCDFVVAEQLPPAFVSLFEREARVFGRDTITPVDFLQHTRPPASFEKAQRVADLIDQIAAN